MYATLRRLKNPFKELHSPILVEQNFMYKRNLIKNKRNTNYEIK